MKQFKTLFYKEFGRYFHSSFAYMILFIYMFVSVGSAFYFGAYLTLHDPAVYALFYLQPFILTALLPAITMRLWSEEYKSGTAEFLLTQPLKAWQPALAKFCAALALSIVLTLFLLPFITYTSFHLSLDIGNIICSYLGLWFITALFCALGTFISAFNKHLIAAYLLSVFAMALWLALPITGLYPAYTDFLLAEIGLSDILYFVLFTATLLYLNIMVLQYQHSAQNHKFLRFGGFSLLCFIGTALLVFASDLAITRKFDFTAHRFYTPQTQTRNLISRVNQPLNIDVYIAKDFRNHNVEYFRYYQQVRRFLEKYQTLSGKMIRVNTTEVEPFSQLENTVLKYGLYYEENPSGTKDYLGAVIRDNNAQGITIKQFSAPRSPYLEKDIDTALLKFVATNELTRNIGVYIDPFQNLDSFNGFLLNLEEDYNIIRVTDTVYELSEQLDLLILINPKVIPTSLLYAIDQYLMNGGKLLIFFDLLSKNQTDDVNLQMLSIIRFLDHWEVLLEDKLINQASAAPEYYTGDLPLNIYKAAEFDVLNTQLTAQPIIYGIDNKYVGAVLNGTFTSLFEENPYDDAKIRNNMLVHNPISSEGSQVALIGDVDLLDDEYWIDERSSDKNPYSAIYKTANMEMLRNLIDDMLQITEYRALPLRSFAQNTRSIGQKLYDRIFGAKAQLYLQLNEAIEELKSNLAEQAENNPDKAAALSLVSDSGSQIAELEKQSDALLYQLKNEYNSSTNLMISLNLLWIPLLSVLGLWLILRYFRRRRQKHIREQFND